ncbi:MAG: HesA/MoeB/ThiF family protein [Streptococcaceae bacterium]|nr:HesA/MoeB/ThiF family protein [Streptococcaceae bacterium]
MTSDFARYKRQIQVLGTDGQEKLARATVLLVGCGAIGTQTAETLVRAGIGQLLLVDFDRVELSNLQRQTLFDEADIGQQKVEAAAKKLRRINSQVEMTVFDSRFDTLDFDTLKPDLVLDATDNFLVREQINDYCLASRIPWVFAAVAGKTGQVMAFSADEKCPCLACAFPDLYKLEANCESLGVVAPIVQMVSSLETALAIRILTADASVRFDEMRVIDWTGEVATFSVGKRENCPVCGSFEPLSALTKVCGGVWQGFISQSVNFAATWQLTENRLATRAKFADKEITLFKNGRILFYGFDEKPTGFLERQVTGENRNFDDF